ncbi:unnamed protein product [Microthlaspi erraticum]|uniref:Uncharacterized protein n=1 Tax=Microthlaspi erraticum TaxID=1685480 RepID=A0A6D2I9D0_9BRAS|nr:unnamed protein product [Microthlaspi erraticum]
MTAAPPELSSLMEDTLRKRQGFWYRILEFILKMTSGVVYSIVMHCLLMTAFVLLLFQIFYTNEFDNLDQVMKNLNLFNNYLVWTVGEVVVRRLSDDPLFLTKSGHFAHMVGSFFLIGYLEFPLNPIETLLFALVGTSLVCWTMFVFFASLFLLLLFSKEMAPSLIEPLV